MQSHIKYIFFNTFPLVQRKPDLEHVSLPKPFPKVSRDESKKRTMSNKLPKTN
jgi:hypothetical protein